MAEIAIATAINIAIQTAIAYAFPNNTQTEGQRLDDLGVVGSAYGAGIPTLYGRDRLPGNIIWATKLREEKLTDEYSAGKGSTITATTYQYYATFAALRALGAQPRYTEYEGERHVIWHRAYGEDGLLPWLLDQRLSGAPCDFARLAR